PRADQLAPAVATDDGAPPSQRRPAKGGPRPVRGRRGPDSWKGTLAKIVLLGLADALAVYILMALFLSRSWVVFGIAAAVTLGINWIYLRKGGLPAKYLAPGVLFLLVFQVFVVVYSGYIAFTNYGDGHNSTKEDAIAAILTSSQKRVPDSPAYRTSVLEKGSTFYLLVTSPDGKTELGTTGHPLADAQATKDSSGKATGVDGYETLTFQEIVAHQKDVLALAVPFSSDPADGSLHTQDGRSAYVFKSTMVYDKGADTLTDTATGTVYRDSGQGSFAAPSGEKLATGWKIDVGFKNFVTAFADEGLRGPLLAVTAWTFTFAIASVALTFALGLFLAITFNRSDLHGKRVYRIIMILPYAFPAFLSGLVWAGLLNPEFGFINNALLGGAHIGWLTDPVLAKISVLVVNLWLGFPYMFLVCTGALQSLPEDVEEAARVDGASAWRIFRSIKLPLLLVSVAPLLISSFAFNFNNFNVIYMLTAGGPRFADTTRDIGATDILITLVYKSAFGVGTGRDYGLASALAIIIFIIVAVISAVSFKQTKALEDVN
ncbi:ABC transporter permease subunit, partial [Sinomonas sp. G460-2]|uniref:ABC transporter permease subunit n=1 Tax=Sinomonas sp. G460-2 TaxID=3393464 RepID=UPI0039EE6473